MVAVIKEIMKMISHAVMEFINGPTTSSTMETGKMDFFTGKERRFFQMEQFSLEIGTVVSLKDSVNARTPIIVATTVIGKLGNLTALEQKPCQMAHDIQVTGLKAKLEVTARKSFLMELYLKEFGTIQNSKQANVLIPTARLMKVNGETVNQKAKAQKLGPTGELTRAPGFKEGRLTKA
jgi:hypothetical protein